MPLPLIIDFGDEAHSAGESGIQVDGFDFGPIGGEVWAYANSDRSGASDQLTFSSWSNNLIDGVTVPGTPNNSPGTVYLFVQRFGDMAWSPAYTWALVAGIERSATVTATGTVTASGHLEISRTATVTASGTVTATGSLTIQRTAAVSATGSVTATVAAPTPPATRSRGGGRIIRPSRDGDKWWENWEEPQPKEPPPEPKETLEDLVAGLPPESPRPVLRHKRPPIVRRASVRASGRVHAAGVHTVWVSPQMAVQRQTRQMAALFLLSLID